MVFMWLARPCTHTHLLGCKFFPFWREVIRGLCLGSAIAWKASKQAFVALSVMEASTRLRTLWFWPKALEASLMKFLDREQSAT